MLEIKKGDLTILISMVKLQSVENWVGEIQAPHGTFRSKISADWLPPNTYASHVKDDPSLIGVWEVDTEKMEVVCEGYHYPKTSSNNVQLVVSWEH